MIILDIDDEFEAQLRLRAERHGRSVEDEARDVLHSALRSHPISGLSLAQEIRALVEPFGAVELELPARERVPEPPGFSE